MKTNLDIDTELHHIECEESMKKCLKNLSEGNSICDLEYPNFRDIEVKIIGLNLQNIYWKAVHVQVMETGLQKEIEVSEQVEGFGFGMEPEYHMVTKQVPVTDEWVNVEWLKNYRTNKIKDNEKLFANIK